MDAKNEQAPVIDADIEKIIEDNEAEVGTLLAVYEPVERNYMAALQNAAAVVTYSTNTTAL
jgi:hypothetical protein